MPQPIDADTLLSSPAHAALVDTDARLGAIAELAETRRRLERARLEMDALRSSTSWRVGSRLVRTAAYVRIMPRKARSLVRLIVLRFGR